MTVEKSYPAKYVRQGRGRPASATMTPTLVALAGSSEPKIYYHGTSVPDVTHILPASKHKGEVTYEGTTSIHHAYATPHVEEAWEYAQESFGGSKPGRPRRPRVYKVRAIGGDHHVEDDPEYETVKSPIDGRTFQSWRGTRPDDKRSKVGFEVLGEEEVPDHVKERFHVNHEGGWNYKEDD